MSHVTSEFLVWPGTSKQPRQMRQAAASSDIAAADDTVATGWLGKDCGAHGMRALRLLHRATQGGKQRRARGDVS